MLYELLNFGQSTNNKLRGLSDLMNLILYEMYYIHLKKNRLMMLFYTVRCFL